MWKILNSFEDYVGKEERNINSLWYVWKGIRIEWFWNVFCRSDDWVWGKGYVLFVRCYWVFYFFKCIIYLGNVCVIFEVCL